jgi:predicted  nucleic acid-binding Zn-ribbon protein
MQPLVENLVKLQAIELERGRLTHEARALPAEITQAHVVLAAAERQSADASAALAREESLRTRLEREIDTHRKKVSRLRVQADTVTTPAQAEAIEHEINFGTAEADRLENEELASMERTEALETALAQARTQVELLAAALETIRDRISLRQQELAAKMAALNVDREALRAAIDPDWLDRFDRLAAARGTGITRADDQQCTGCSMGVRPQTWNQLREGELLTCDSCSRLLYWDPAMAPAPKAPQPEAVPGAGRPLRKPGQAGA